jgi:hypothetical protein
MKIKILPDALDDLARGYKFYECQESGFGDYFLDSLFSDIDSLLVSAGIHSIHFGLFRLLSKRFPFAIYYTIEDSVVIVTAVLDCRYHPDTIQKRFL